MMGLSRFFGLFLIITLSTFFIQSDASSSNPPNKCIRYEEEAKKFNAIKRFVMDVAKESKSINGILAKQDITIDSRYYGELYDLRYNVTVPMNFSSEDLKFSENYTWESAISFKAQISGYYFPMANPLRFGIPFNIFAEVSTNAKGKICLPYIIYDEGIENHLIHTSIDQAAIKSFNCVINGIPSITRFYGALPMIIAIIIFNLPIITRIFKLSFIRMIIRNGDFFLAAIAIAEYVIVFHVILYILINTIISILYTLYKDNLTSIYNIKSLFYDPLIHGNPKQSTIEMQYFNDEKLSLDGSIQ